MIEVSEVEDAEARQPRDSLQHVRSHPAIAAEVQYLECFESPPNIDILKEWARPQAQPSEIWGAVGDDLRDVASELPEVHQRQLLQFAAGRKLFESVLVDVDTGIEAVTLHLQAGEFTEVPTQQSDEVVAGLHHETHPQHLQRRLQGGELLETLVCQQLVEVIGLAAHSELRQPLALRYYREHLIPDSVVFEQVQHSYLSQGLLSDVNPSVQQTISRGLSSTASTMSSLRLGSIPTKHFISLALRIFLRSWL